MAIFVDHHVVVSTCAFEDYIKYMIPALHLATQVPRQKVVRTRIKKKIIIVPNNNGYVGMAVVANSPYISAYGQHSHIQ